VCEAFGDPFCYDKHGLVRSAFQIASLADHTDAARRRAIVAAMAEYDAKRATTQRTVRRQIATWSVMILAIIALAAAKATAG
jgi:hypothetical protein